MDKRKSDDIKRLITVLAFIIIIIVLVIILILITHKKSDDFPKSNNTSNNNTSVNNTNNKNDSETNSNIIDSNNTQSNINTGKLEKIIDLESYFWLKDRLSFYYSSNELEDPTMLMDKTVIDELGLTVDNYRNFNNFDGPIFRIDEIYKQNLNQNEILYVVKLRYGKSEKDVKDSIVWVKKDLSSSTFSVYPYEYLRLKNYTNFQEGDTVPVDGSKSIEKNRENSYLENEDDDTEDDTKLCMKGLFERYKFDLLIDREHLYSILEVDYKNSKYSDIEDLKKYINDNKTDLYLDAISEYKVIDYNEFIEYRAICKSQRNYVFNATSECSGVMLKMHSPANGASGGSIQVFGTKTGTNVYEKIDTVTAVDTDTLVPFSGYDHIKLVVTARHSGNGGHSYEAGTVTTYTFV